MISKIEAGKRYHFARGWLDTYHLFSFAEYDDPANVHFGTLRVFNDDTIDPYSGFDEHGHENMEIVTIMLEGELTHRDSLGTAAVIKAGEVQRMTAGTGVVHAEKNLSGERIHLYQIWLLPERSGLPPSYEQKDFSYLQKKNSLSPIAAQKPTGEALKLRADATIYLSELEMGKLIEYRLSKSRGVFIYLREGELSINGLSFGPSDQARIHEEALIKISASKDAAFIFIDVAMSDSR